MLANVNGMLANVVNGCKLILLPTPPCYEGKSMECLRMSVDARRCPWILADAGGCQSSQSGLVIQSKLVTYHHHKILGN